jgi:hypothetical protein
MHGTNMALPKRADADFWGEYDGAGCGFEGWAGDDAERLADMLADFDAGQIERAAAV